MKTNIYVDGFNLYYGIKDTPFKWLDPCTLCRLMLPGDQINRIRYFTARIHARENDFQKLQRQNIFIRALQTIPNLSVHYGTFLSHLVRMPVANPPPNTIEVIKTEEKGSDVNLATFLLTDGFEGDYELAVVISNDSDLVLPVQMVRQKLGLPVGILNPQRDKTKFAWSLMRAATFYRPIRFGVLGASQFPATLHDAIGPFTKPSNW